MATKTATKTSKTKAAPIEAQAQAQETTPKTRKERKKKASFDLSTAVDASGESIELNEEGQLTAVPHNWTDETRMPKRDEFATIDLYFDFREWRETSEHDERMEELKAQRIEAIEGPDPVKVNVKKFKKLASNLEDIKAALEESGVDISELLGS